MAQALTRFLAQQYVERDGRETAFFAGVWGIFGHGNIAGVGQALQQAPALRYYLARNEQAMVHTATAFAKMSNRRGYSHDQSNSSAAPARRYFCAPQRSSRASATRVRTYARHLSQRRLQA